MNSSIIRFILGNVLKIEGLLLFLPVIVSGIYAEHEGFYFAAVGVACLLFGFGMTRKKPANQVFYLKEGCITTSLSWILLSFFGSLPFYLSGEIPSFTDAVFETVSGFTTTGASILSNVEGLSHCALFWRSFTHWIGGMGVLVFLIAVIPLSGGSHINLMRAESPGPSVGKLVPKIRYTARILYMIYLAMTIVEVIFLLFGGMKVFDALTISFGTAGTGGFGIRNDSLASYSPYLQWVVTIFMVLFGVNFNAYYLFLFGKMKKALMMEEVRVYFLILLASTGIIFLNILNTCAGIFDALTKSAFQVGSIMTSTGYSSVDFDLWPQASKTILILLMFIGACAGSTGGGIKVSRIIILIKTIVKELNSYIHPKIIRKVKIEGKPVEHEVVRSTNVYFITFMVIFAASLLALSFEGKSFATNFTAVLATINNIGPGLDMVGPAQNFGHFTVLSKYVLIFDMLAGRLELFPLLILFHPEAWKELYTKRFTKSNG
ncbi:MAG: TrkH family potassium uptake protein [Lachnospiraceae bacterium]|nr:TrkH family potassium uptake protein [Lachnospiraceae bacterium]